MISLVSDSFYFFTFSLSSELLSNEEYLNKMEAWEVREVCLQPLQLALESKARKLGHTALAGIQVHIAAHNEVENESLEKNPNLSYSSDCRFQMLHCYVKLKHCSTQSYKRVLFNKKSNSW